MAVTAERGEDIPSSALSAAAAARSVLCARACVLESICFIPETHSATGSY